MGITSSKNPGSSDNSRPPRTEITERPPPSILEPVHKGFNPTGQDVQIAAHILMGLQLQATPGHLPPELALAILARADYRPRVTGRRAERVDYGPWGGRPWYLTTPMLPPDFGRASSVTLQVWSEERHQVDPAALLLPGGAGAEDHNTPDGAADGTDDDPVRYTWFEMCILRPLLSGSPGPSPGSGYALRGGVLYKVPEPEVQQGPPRPRATGEADEDFQAGVPWDMVRHNGRKTWLVHHHNGTPTRTSTPLRRCETYRVDWSANNNPDTEDPQAFVDSQEFLSALMPGDKIAFWASLEVSKQSDTISCGIEYKTDSDMIM